MIFKYIRIFYNLMFRPDYVVYFGINLFLDKKIISKKIANNIYKYRYELTELNIIDKKVQKDDIILEIGSGIGVTSIYSKKIKSCKKVFTYEANPGLIKLIDKNIKKNNINIEVFNKILTDSSEEYKEFYLSNNFYSSSLFKRDESYKVIKVKSENINEVIIKNDVNCIIMDIEGEEINLIPKINFSQIKKIIIELHPHIVGNDRCNKVVNHLLQNNYLLDTALSGNYVYYFYKQEPI